MEDSNNYCPTMEVSLRVIFEENKTIVLNIKRNSDTNYVYQRVVEELKLTLNASKYCALFEMLDGNFERKLHDGECPHNIYTQNYSSAASSCIVL